MDIQKILQEAFSEVLEDFSFLFLERAEEPFDIPSNVQYICSTIMVRHEQDSFKISLLAPEDVCFEMAANITGSDEEEVTPDMAEDALKELSNITAGDWAVRCFGESEICLLESPTASKLSEEKKRDMLSRNKEKVFQVEDQLVLAQVCLE